MLSTIFGTKSCAFTGSPIPLLPPWPITQCDDTGWWDFVEGRGSALGNLEKCLPLLGPSFPICYEESWSLLASSIDTVSTEKWRLELRQVSPLRESPLLSPFPR